MTMPSQDPTAPGRRPKRITADPEMPILVRPVPKPNRPTVITATRTLTWIQVALVMICGNCSFGWALLGAFAWVAIYFDLSDPFGFGMLSAWIVGFAAITTYAYFVHRWSSRADRRARTTVVIGTAVLVACIAGAFRALGSNPNEAGIVLFASVPSLIVQAIVLGCVYGPEGRRWFASGAVGRMDGSA
ncbi:hypothetical protein GCM10010403_47120 [Glycomyces rutgersensis]